jgi:cation transport ATPase
MQWNYKIHGMHCESCIKKIQKALANAPFNVKHVGFTPPQLQIEATEVLSSSTINHYLAQAGGHYRVEIEQSAGDSTDPLQKASPPSENTEREGILRYYPIFLIAAYLIGVVSLNNFSRISLRMDWMNWMNQFMAGFFLIFSGFKLLDLRGFAEGYATYDLLAKRWPTYGFIYPFLELGLAILYLGGWFPKMTPILTILIMGFSTLGVVNSLLKKQKFQCACLGTFLKVPLSSITLIEDLSMVLLAFFSLWALR